MKAGRAAPKKAKAKKPAAERATPAKTGAKKSAPKRSAAKKAVAKKAAEKIAAPPRHQRVALTKEEGVIAAAPARAITTRADSMLDTLGLTNVELSLALVGDETIADLNQRFRKKAKATDVLSFPLHSVDAGSIVAAAQAGPVVHLGDVIISVPTATRQAKERSRAVLDEMTTLVAHGLLHLLGFDHRNDAEEREMEAFARVLEAAALAKKPLWFRLVPND